MSNPQNERMLRKMSGRKLWLKSGHKIDIIPPYVFYFKIYCKIIKGIFLPSESC